MINKKIILKVFIIFFIAISIILISDTSRANDKDDKNTVKVSSTNITVYVGQTTTVLIKSEIEADNARMG